MAGFVTFSPVLPGDVRQQLEVYAAIKIPRTGLRQLTFDIMHSDALEKKQCATVRRVQTTMEPVVLSSPHSRARAKSQCSILIEAIPTLKSGMTRFYCIDMTTDCSSVHISLSGSLRTIDQFIL
jgi:hypothetical protein